MLLSCLHVSECVNLEILEEFTNCVYRHRTTLAAHDQLYWLEPSWPHLHLRYLELNGHLRAVDSLNHEGI